jgi:hypothetical protein
MPLTNKPGFFNKVRQALFQNVPGTPEGPLGHLQRINAFADRSGPQKIQAVGHKAYSAIQPKKVNRSVGILKVGHVAGQRAALRQLGLL